jgi:hypothetical protein
MYEACATEMHLRMLTGEGIATAMLHHHSHLVGSCFDAQVDMSCLQRLPWAAAFHCNAVSLISLYYVNVYNMWGLF